MSDAAARVENLLGTSVRAVTHCGAGHAGALYRVRLVDGREQFVKTADGSGAGAVLDSEAAGLRWLAQGDRRGVVAPVSAADGRTLVLPWLESVRPSASAAEEFGRALADLHAAGPGMFGAPWDGYIATVPQDNTPTFPRDDSPTGEWGRWYADRRLAPLLADAGPDLGRAGVDLIERVLSEIDTLAGVSEPPSRIHGDLWSGNLLWTADGVRVVDPAAHGGHRETDLAMLALFGAPHLDRIVSAYREVSPLAPGWRQRIPLHQLYPLLVHVVLFGGGYRGATVAAAEAALQQ